MTLVQPGQAPSNLRRGVARRFAPTVLRALLELALVAALFELYRLGRLVARGETHAAYEHALDVHHVERFLHLPSESAIQALVPSDTLLHLANLYYFSVHFPAMIAFLVWGYLFKPRTQYLWARNMVILLTGTALVVHIVYPLAPPRMFPQWGFVDTMAVVGPDAYDGTSGALANQFAAMPSLHVGWAALMAYVIFRTGPRWLAAIAALHLVVTMLVVVVTANHYWLDGIIALVLVAVASRIVRLPEGEPAARSRSWPVRRIERD